jgi:hypothetical protein
MEEIYEQTKDYFVAFDRLGIKQTLVRMEEGSVDDVTRELYDGTVFYENEKYKMMVLPLMSQVLTQEITIPEDTQNIFYPLEGPLIRVCKFAGKILISTQKSTYANSTLAPNMMFFNENHMQKCNFFEILMQKFGNIFDRNYDYSPFVYYFRYMDNSYNNFNTGVHPQVLIFLGCLNMFDIPSNRVPKESSYYQENPAEEKENWESKPFKSLKFPRKSNPAEIEKIRKEYLQIADSGQGYSPPVLCYTPRGLVRFYPRCHLNKIFVRNGARLEHAYYNSFAQFPIKDCEESFVTNAPQYGYPPDETILKNIFKSSLSSRDLS